MFNLDKLKPIFLTAFLLTSCAPSVVATSSKDVTPTPRSPITAKSRLGLCTLKIFAETPPNPGNSFKRLGPTVFLAQPDYARVSQDANFELTSPCVELVLRNCDHASQASFSDSNDRFSTSVTADGCKEDFLSTITRVGSK